MKKMISLVMSLVVLALVLTGCSATKEAENYDNKLVAMGEENFSGFRNSLKDYDNQKYSVVKNSDDSYTAKIDGENTTVLLPEPGDKIIPRNIEELKNKKIQKIVTQSKKLVISYIKESSILKDKEELISNVEAVETKMANINNAPALYYNEVLYIDNEYKDFVCEWMICHELIHYVCELTNGGRENEVYGNYILNEAITDVITKSMEPDIIRNYQSGYTEFHYPVLLYLGLLKEEALKAYFYGYDNLWEKIGSNDEFDFFVVSFENYYVSDFARNCVNRSLIKWANIVEKQ